MPIPAVAGGSAIGPPASVDDPGPPISANELPIIPHPWARLNLNAETHSVATFRRYRTGSEDREPSSNPFSDAFAGEEVRFFFEADRAASPLPTPIAGRPCTADRIGELEEFALHPPHSPSAMSPRSPVLRSYSS